MYNVFGRCPFDAALFLWATPVSMGYARFYACGVSNCFYGLAPVSMFLVV